MRVRRRRQHTGRLPAKQSVSGICGSTRVWPRSARQPVPHCPLVQGDACCAAPARTRSSTSSVATCAPLALARSVSHSLTQLHTHGYYVKVVVYGSQFVIELVRENLLFVVWCVGINLKYHALVPGSLWEYDHLIRQLLWTPPDIVRGSVGNLQEFTNFSTSFCVAGTPPYTRVLDAFICLRFITHWHYRYLYIFIWYKYLLLSLIILELIECW